MRMRKNDSRCLKGEYGRALPDLLTRYIFDFRAWLSNSIPGLCNRLESIFLGEYHLFFWGL